MNMRKTALFIEKWMSILKFQGTCKFVIDCVNNHCTKKEDFHWEFFQ